MSRFHRSVVDAIKTSSSSSEEEVEKVKTSKKDRLVTSDNGHAHIHRLTPVVEERDQSVETLDTELDIGSLFVPCQQL